MFDQADTPLKVLDNAMLGDPLFTMSEIQPQLVPPPSPPIQQVSPPPVPSPMRLLLSRLLKRPMPQMVPMPTSPAVPPEPLSVPPESSVEYVFDPRVTILVDLVADLQLRVEVLEQRTFAARWRRFRLWLRSLLWP